MLVIAGDHLAGVAGFDRVTLLAIPVLWIVGVVVFVALKLRSR